MKLPVLSVRSAVLTALVPVHLLATGLPDRASAEEGVLSASDRIALEMAANACKTRDFRTFFNAFIMSGPVRQTYGAATITFARYGRDGQKKSEEIYTAATYPHLPVTLQDYDYKPARPSRLGDEDEYLDLQFNQSQNNDVSVDWSRVHYDGQSTGGDDRGNAVDARGNLIPAGLHPDPEGQLLFHPTDDCWEFGEDIRFDAS